MNRTPSKIQRRTFAAFEPPSYAACKTPPTPPPSYSKYMETLALSNSTTGTQHKPDTRSVFPNHRPWRIFPSFRTQSDLPTEAGRLRVQNRYQPDSELRVQHHREPDIPASASAPAPASAPVSAPVSTPAPTSASAPASAPVSAPVLASSRSEPQNRYQPSNQSIRIGRRIRYQPDIPSVGNGPGVQNTHRPDISPGRSELPTQHRLQPNITPASTGPHNRPSSQSLRIGRRIPFQPGNPSVVDRPPVRNQNETINLPDSIDPFLPCQNVSVTSPEENRFLLSAPSSYETPPPSATGVRYWSTEFGEGQICILSFPQELTDNAMNESTSPYSRPMRYRRSVMFSCFVVWCCFGCFAGSLLGAIALLLNVCSEQSQKKNDTRRARRLKTAACIIASAGVIVGILAYIVLITLFVIYICR